MDGDGAHWGGTTTTANIHGGGRSRNSVIRKSIDVVAGLFQMSNELREERENIMTRTAKDGGNNSMEAFINRETTLKYNDELEEVAQVILLLKSITNMTFMIGFLSIRIEQARFNINSTSCSVIKNS